MEQLELLEQTERVDPGFVWQAIATMALRRYWFYLRIVLDYRWMDPWLHGEEVCAFLDLCELEEKDCCVLMPRGTGKTGSITQPRPAWWLARKPDSRVLLANAEEKKAAKMARSSANIMALNPIYRRCFPDVRPSNKWGEDGYYLDSLAGDEDEFTINVERVDPSLGSYGIRGNITGAHVNGGMILDDLINAEMARHPNEVKRAGRFFSEAINCIDPGTPLVVCATRWTYHDYCGDIERGELRGRRGRLEVLKLGATRKNSKTGKEELLYPAQSWKDDRGTEHHVGMTFENLEDFKRQLKGLFPALYYNEPVLDEDCLFDVHLLKRYSGLGELGFELGPIGRIAIEQESQASSLMSTINLLMAKEGVRLAIEGVRSGRVSKKERILATMQPLIADGLFHMREDSWQREDGLGEEMRTFDKGYDDALDAHAYCIMLCQQSPNEDPPRVNIAVDPAFTEQEYSDYSAIAVGCMRDGEYYELETIKFQTNRADVLVRMLFNVAKKFDNLASNSPKQAKRGMRGFSSYQARARTPQLKRGGFYKDTHTFDVDLRGFMRDGGK